MIPFVLLCFICLIFVLAAAIHSRESLIGLSIVFVVIGNLITGKLFPIFGLTVYASAPIFVMIFILSNLINTYYGKEEAQKTVWYSFAGSVVAIVLGWLAINLPTGMTPDMDKAIANLFGFLPRVFIASLVAFLISMTINVRLYALLEKRLPQRLSFLAGYSATPISLILDTVLFIGIAFGLGHPALWEMILTGICLRIAILIISNPVMILIALLRPKFEHKAP